MEFQQKRIIAIVGMCGTGKSSVVNLLLKLIDAEVLYFGGVVLEEMGRLSIEQTPENERKIQKELRISEGNDVLAKRMIPQINNKSKDVILDGLYSTTEYETLKEEYGDRMICIAIHANKSIRYNRLERRTSRPLTKEEVDKRDISEIKHIEKGGPIGLSDYHIINNGNIKDLELQLKNIFKSLP